MGRISYLIIVILLVAAHANSATVIGQTRFTNYSTNRQAEINSKVSTSNLKTINGASILGSGNLTVSGASLGTMTRLTSTWASSSVANTTGIIGTGTVPMTSPTYAAGAPFSFNCVISTLRAATTNGPRYGVAASSGSITRVSMHGHIGLAGTAPARTQNIQEVIGPMTSDCATFCTSAITASTQASVKNDIFSGTGVMNASGTVSLYMAPSAGAANTAQIGSYCIWY